jgi:hypothetical protein
MTDTPAATLSAGNSTNVSIHFRESRLKWLGVSAPDSTLTSNLFLDELDVQDRSEPCV